MKPKQLVKQGIDPTAFRQQQQKQAEQERLAKLWAQADSFEGVARAWHKDRYQIQKKWSSVHAQQIRRMLEANVFPAIGSIPIVEVTAPRLLEVIKVVAERGVLETARKISRHIHAVFRYAVVCKLVHHNEADNLRDELPTQAVQHNPHLTIDDIPP